LIVVALVFASVNAVKKIKDEVEVPPCALGKTQIKRSKDQKIKLNDH